MPFKLKADVEPTPLGSRLKPNVGLKWRAEQRLGFAVYSSLGPRSGLLSGLSTGELGPGLYGHPEQQLC